MKRTVLIVLAFGLVGSLATWSAWADEDKDEAQDASEVTMTIDKAPTAVQNAIRKAAGSATVTEVEKETEDGLTLYEAGWKVGDVNHEVVVNESGDVMETEMVVAGDAVPVAVRATAAKHLPRGAKAEYEKKMVVLYEVEAVVDGKEIEFLVDPSGRVMELEAADDDHDHDHEGEDKDDDDDDDDDDK